jgi:hypothetical protein
MFEPNGPHQSVPAGASPAAAGTWQRPAFFRQFANLNDYTAETWVMPA